MATQANNWKIEATLRNARIDARLSALGLNMAAEFVPASTFKDDEWKRGAINFNATITARGTVIYRGPYAYSVGNLPNYSHHWATKLCGAPILAAALERGVWPADGLKSFDGGRTPSHKTMKVPAPSLRDVLYSLLNDASAIDLPDFETWASEYGYDADSRSAEATYRACLDTGLKLRAALGNSVLAELRELFQDY